jgi:hypothetical protein
MPNTQITAFFVIERALSSCHSEQSRKDVRSFVILNEVKHSELVIALLHVVLTYLCI